MKTQKQMYILLFCLISIQFYYADSQNNYVEKFASHLFVRKIIFTACR